MDRTTEAQKMDRKREAQKMDRKTEAQKIDRKRETQKHRVFIKEQAAQAAWSPQRGVFFTFLFFGLGRLAVFGFDLGLCWVVDTRVWIWFCVFSIWVCLGVWARGTCYNITDGGR